MASSSRDLGVQAFVQPLHAFTAVIRTWRERATVLALSLLFGLISATTTLAAAPTIVRVSGITVPPGVVVVFSEAVTPATANVPANYTLSGGLAVVSAVVNSATVTLSTSAQASGAGSGPLYTLAVANVQNFGGTPVAPGTQKSFTSDSGTRMVVNTFTDKNTPGTGPASLREAIIGANNGAGPDTIVLPAGTYPLTIAGVGEDAAATGDLDILDDVTILGAAQGSTIIDAGGLGDRVFHVAKFAGAALTIQFSNLTIQNGNGGSDGGGGILLLGPNQLSLNTVTLSGNSATEGGGVLQTNIANLVLLNTTFKANSASIGGGISTMGPILAEGCSFLSDNSSGTGGAAVYSRSSGAQTFKNCTFSANTTFGNGAGYYAESGATANFLNCTFNLNTAAADAAIHNSGAAVNVSARNCIFDNSTGGSTSPKTSAFVSGCCPEAIFGSENS